MKNATVNIEDIRQFLYREARLLDEKKWEEWLTYYDEDCPFWMPSWDDDGQLISDPQREISLIYYPDRRSLDAEDVTGLKPVTEAADAQLLCVVGERSVSL